ncbi:predicted protein, partial [Nematostella vectensis]
LSAEEVPLQFREQFIISGYRRPYASARDCIKSAFGPYNETLNFWTHFVPFLLFSARFVWTFHRDGIDLYRLPLVSFALGICGFLLMSSCAHLFNSMSPRIRHCCFFCDYSAISVYSVGAGLSFYFYSRPIGVGVFPPPKVYITGSILISLLSTTLCCASRHRWANYKYAIRTGSFVLAFLYNCLPHFYRFIIEGADKLDPVAMSYFKRHTVFYLIAAVANTTRIPERLIPGVFDVIGHSHNFLHIFTALGVADQYTAMELEMIHREPILKHLHVDVYSKSLNLMICALLANIGIVVLFGVRL